MTNKLRIIYTNTNTESMGGSSNGSVITDGNRVNHRRSSRSMAWLLCIVFVQKTIIIHSRETVVQRWESVRSTLYTLSGEYIIVYCIHYQQSKPQRHRSHPEIVYRGHTGLSTRDNTASHTGCIFVNLCFRILLFLYFVIVGQYKEPQWW